MEYEEVNGAGWAGWADRSTLYIVDASAKNTGIGIYRDSQAPCNFFTKHL